MPGDGTHHAIIAVEGRRGEAVIFGRFQVIVGGVGVGEDWRLVWL